MNPETAIQSKKFKRGMESRAPFINRSLLFLPLLLTLCALPIHAQTYLGALIGRVSDATGARIAGATVTATDTTTHFSTKAVTNGSGSYSIPSLTPDTYNISVERPGFRRQTSTGIVLTASISVETDFKLSVGSSSQSVTVIANNSLLNTESADLEQTFTAKQVADLPNIGRVPFFVATLAPGMYDSTYMTSTTSVGAVPYGNAGTAIVGDGMGGGRTLITLNGILDDPHEHISGGGGDTYGGFVPSPGAVQEVTAQTASYDAGAIGGTVINTVLRSGTNSYHGAVYYVFRNTYLNANDYQRVPTQHDTLNPKADTPRTNGTWDQPGFVVDGPVRIPHIYDGRNKTYFMAAYERIQLRASQAAADEDFVPTAAEAGGDFSALCPGGFNASGVCNPGGGVQIYDPLTLDASNNRTPFPNDIIPANRISPVGAALVKYFPAPNSDISSILNYIAPDPIMRERYYSFVTRIDQSINENNKFNAVFFREILNQNYPDMGFPKGIGPYSGGDDDQVYRNDEGGSLNYVGVLPRDWVLNARVGVIEHPFGGIEAGAPFDLSSIGISPTGIGNQTFPGLDMSDDYAGLMPASNTELSNDTLGSSAVILSKVIGNHNLNFGFEGDLDRYNGENPLSGLGTFAFNREFTQENSVNTAVGADASSGNPIASLLLGYPSSGTYAVQVSFALQQPMYGLFIQDDWRATQKLVLNMGLRWDDEVPYTERYNRLNTGFCTTCTNPLQSSVSGLNLLGGLEFATPSNRGYYKNYLTHFQPRFGASYGITPNIVFHAGVGLIYLNSLESPYGQGYSASTNYTATTDSTHPATSFADPFPSGVIQPSGSSLGLATLVGQSLDFIAPHHVEPSLLHWSASTQAGLPGNMVFALAFAGGRTYNWENSKNINALPAQYNTGTASNVTYLEAKVPNPMAGTIPTSPTLNAATIERQYLDLPFPEFGTLTEEYIPSGGTLYNALQATLNKPMGHGLSVLGAFTWAKEMDSLEYLNPTDSTPARYEDPNPTIMGTLAFMYELPSFSSRPRYERSVLGGWQLNGVFRAYNGILVANPANVTELSDPRLAHPTVNRFFNTCYLNAAGQMVMTTSVYPACDSASSIPAFQEHYSFALNNIGPYMDDVRRSPGTRLDVSLFRTFQIYKSTTLQIRGEFFNVLNTALFEGPYTTPGASTYGKVPLTQENEPRIAQLNAFINF